MTRRKSWFLALPLAACSAPADSDTDLPAADYSVAGPRSVVETSGETTLASCTMAWTRFTPDAPADVLVVLSHGFARTQAQMADHARLFASHGVEVVTPGLCHATFSDADHAQNGADLAELVTSLGAGSVLYAGYSAGGLASVLAGAGDARTVGVLSLDGVDSGDLGAAAIPSLTPPLAGLVGEPSQCNAENNGVGWFAAGEALRVVGADHCDFEGPTDGLCEALCARDSDPTTTVARRQTIRTLATAWIAWRATGDEAGAEMWTPGAAAYEGLRNAGTVAPLD